MLILAGHDFYIEIATHTIFVKIKRKDQTIEKRRNSSFSFFTDFKLSGILDHFNCIRLKVAIYNKLESSRMHVGTSVKSLIIFMFWDSNVPYTVC